MRKKLVFLLSAIVLASFFVYAYTEEDEERPKLFSPFMFAQPTQLPEDAPSVNWQGERLEYTIRWGLISVGTADLSVNDVVSIEGKTAYHILSTATSGSVIDAFFKVRDINESWIDVYNFNSIGYAKQIREGSYKADEWVMFNTENKTFAGQEQKNDNPPKFSTGEIPGPVQDILSSLYYIRKSDLKVGQDIVFDVNTTENWPLVVKVVKKETIAVPAGRFECFLVEPKLREEGVFVQKGKRVRVWVTADERKIPVLMKAEVFIGDVAARLLRIDNAN
jgi:Protein of unknown function (DUF3108)